MAMDKKKAQKFIINTVVIIIMAALLGVAGRYLAGFLLIKTFHLPVSLDFNTYSDIRALTGENASKKTQLILNAALGVQILAVVIVPLVTIIAFIAKLTKKAPRYGNAKWANNKQLSHLEDKGAYRK
jgi:type IV secretory pathway TraG/TraD family ATPase VirD4